MLKLSFQNMDKWNQEMPIKGETFGHTADNSIH